MHLARFVVAFAFALAGCSSTNVTIVLGDGGAAADTSDVDAEGPAADAGYGRDDAEDAGSSPDDASSDTGADVDAADADDGSACHAPGPPATDTLGANCFALAKGDGCPPCAPWGFRCSKGTRPRLIYTNDAGAVLAMGDHFCVAAPDCSFASGLASYCINDSGVPAEDWTASCSLTPGGSDLAVGSVPNGWRYSGHPGTICGN